MSGAGKMVQWLSMLDTLSEDQGLTLSIQGPRWAVSLSPVTPVSGAPAAASGLCRYMHTHVLTKAHIRIIKYQIRLLKRRASTQIITVKNVCKRTEQTYSLIYDILHYLWKEAQGNYGFNILII